MSALPTLNFLDLFRTDFRCSTEADGLNLRLIKELQVDFRYQPARIAMALSLADAKLPPAAPDVLGKPIRGETLFGQEQVEVAVWVGLIVEHSGEASLSRRALQDAVAAHWTRGIEMLWLRWSRWEGSSAAFLADLTRNAAPQKSVAA